MLIVPETAVRLKIASPKEPAVLVGFPLHCSIVPEIPPQIDRKATWVTVSIPHSIISIELCSGLALMSWSTSVVPFAVQTVPVTAAGFTTRLPLVMMLVSSLGIATPNATPAERRIVTSTEVYVMRKICVLKG